MTEQHLQRTSFDTGVPYSHFRDESGKIREHHLAKGMLELIRRNLVHWREQREIDRHGQRLTIWWECLHVPTWGGHGQALTWEDGCSPKELIKEINEVWERYRLLADDNERLRERLAELECGE